MSNIEDIPTLKDKFMERLNSLGQKLQEQCTYWQNMKFKHSKDDVEQFAYDRNVLPKTMGIPDEQALDNFKKAFSTKDQISFARDKWHRYNNGLSESSYCFFKSKLPNSTSTSMLAHMTERS